MSHEYETILYHVTDGVAAIIFNRPDKYNAFTQKMIIETIEAVQAAARDESVRAVILTGAGKAFSSGQDLHEMGALVAEGARGNQSGQSGQGGQIIADHLRRGYNQLVRHLRTLEKPVIGAINGVAVGAGCSIALACDIRVCAEDASFVFAAFANIGLIPDGGGTLMLPRLVGMARAFQLAILADNQNRIDAAAALAMGLVAQVVPGDQLMAETERLACKLAAMPTRAIGLTKRALNQAWTNTLDESLELEAVLQGEAGETQDFREGVAAFIEKRAPHFQGM